MKLDNYCLLSVAAIFLCGLLVIGGLWGASALMDNLKDKQKLKIIPECTKECQKYDMSFLELVNDGWMYDCWCIGETPEYIKRYDGNDYGK